MTATNPTTDLVSLAERLTDLLAQEMALLKSATPGAIAPLQADKSRLARAYEEKASALSRDPGALSRLPVEIKGRLRDVMTRFQRSVGENARALLAAKEANERLIRAITEAVAERNGRLDLYGPAGAKGVGLYGPSGEPRAVSLSLDRRL